MTSRMIRFASLSAAIALAVGLIAGVAHAADRAKVGQKAPDFAAKDQNGNDVKLSNFKGKAIVLEWLNPNCPYVKRHYEAGTMQKLASQYGKGGEVVWLAVSSSGSTSAADMKAFAGKHKLSYPILLDSDGTIGKAYGAKTTPHLFVIDKQGNLAYAGGIDNDEDGDKSSDRIDYVKNALDELKAGKTVSTPETRSYGCGIKYKD